MIPSTSAQRGGLLLKHHLWHGESSLGHDALVCCSEMSWLINTTWAIGSKHAHAKRYAKALAFMAAAIDLMDLCEDFKDRKKVQLLPIVLCCMRSVI